MRQLLKTFAFCRLPRPPALLVLVCFFLIAIVCRVEAQSTLCRTVGGSAALPAFSGPNPPGPYYLRIYFHSLQNPFFSESQGPDDVETILGILNADFNPHNIFFVSACALHSFEVDFDVYSFGWLCEVDDYNHADGIDIYLMGDDSAPLFQGEANGIPSDYFIVGGPSDGTAPSAAKSHTISHEMAHCLGLYHTFHGTVTEGKANNCQMVEYGDDNECPELVDGSNNTVCGDHIADTPADPDVYGQVDIHTCEYIGTSVDANGDHYDPDKQNIMSATWNGCMKYFTPKQGEWMRNTIETTPILQACLTQPLGTTTDIYTNTIYHTDMQAPGSIVVHSGAELVVEATLRMRQGYRILVERNARLIVDNQGVLTRACDAAHWDGVYVMGNSAWVQPERGAPLTNPHLAGIVWLDNCRVEWALTGVSAGGGYKAENWGGLIWAHDAVFASNQRDLEFMPYAAGPNKARFYDCDFEEIGDPFANTEGAVIQATDGIVFDQCRFKGKDYVGIRAYDAAVTVTNQSEFEGNQYGITSFASYQMSSNLDVMAGPLGENKFKDNRYHIYASLATGLWGGYSGGLNGLNVINNDFENGNYGVIMEGPSSFQVGGNLFTNIPIGTWAANTGYNNESNSNLIACNRYQGGNNWGIATIGNNLQMRFHGNAFSMGSSGRDFLLISSWANGLNGSIRGDQGGPGDPAENCFTNPSLQTDIITWGSTDFFKYYVDKTPPLGCFAFPQAPGNYSKVATQNLTPDICPDFGNLPPGFENPTPGDLTAKRQQIQALLPYIQTDSSLRAAYYQALLEKDAILRHIVRNALAQGQTTAAENYLLDEQTKAGNLAAYGLKMRRKAYTEARTFLNSLPVANTDDTWFKGVQLINLDRLEQGPDFLLTAQRQTYLENVANSTSPVRAYARAILSLLTGARYVPDEIEVDERQNPPGQPTAVLPMQAGLRAVPNPATELVMLSWPDLGEAADATLLITDALGRSVITLHPTPGEVSRQVSVAAWPVGLYFAAIRVQGQTYHHTRLMVQH